MKLIILAFLLVIIGCHCIPFQRDIEYRQDLDLCNARVQEVSAENSHLKEHIKVVK